MLLDTEIKHASDLCVNYNIPFAVVALPYSNSVEFYADSSVTPVDIDNPQEDVFFFNTYGNEWKLPFGITKRFTAGEIIDRYKEFGNVTRGQDYRIITESTEQDYYIDSLNGLISDLKRRRGKTVISRVICGKSTTAWGETADKYFTNFPNAFRAFYFTPFTGGWLVASPELLLESQQGMVGTMSLAGTRECGPEMGEWDKKNTEEHDYVTRFIVECLHLNGIIPEVGEAESVKFGSIEHLCHKIQGRYNGRILPLIHSLSPTPALAGEPRDIAMADIAAIEKHSRRCYSGYIGIKKKDTAIVYANLRCLNFIGENYCIYAGGGITCDSVPEKEWDETEKKSVYLRSLL